MDPDTGTDQNRDGGDNGDSNYGADGGTSTKVYPDGRVEMYDQNGKLTHQGAPGAQQQAAARPGVAQPAPKASAAKRPYTPGDTWPKPRRSPLITATSRGVGCSEARPEYIMPPDPATPRTACYTPGMGVS